MLRPLLIFSLSGNVFGVAEVAVGDLHEVKQSRQPAVSRPVGQTTKESAEFAHAIGRGNTKYSHIRGSLALLR